MGGRKEVRRFSDKRLEAVRIALFPEPTKNADGSFTLHDADENLHSALYDLRRLKADKVCIATVTTVLGQLYAARRALTESRWDNGEKALAENPSAGERP